jgi:hypothetical protein
MHTRITVLIALAILLCSSVAFAVPTKLSQQGRLIDGDGAPLTGSHSLAFTLHDAETAGNEVWNEEHSVEFEEGYYSIVLGTVAALEDLLFAGSTVWLQLSVDGVVLSPRQEVVSVPYALRAAVAEAVEGGTVDADEISIGGNVVIDSAGNWLGTPTDWNALTGVPADLADGDGDTLQGLACIDGQVPTYDSASALWVCAAPSSMDTLALLSCLSGELVTWDDSNSQWVCSPDLDTQLTEAQVDAFVANNNYSTGAHTTDTDTLLGLPCADGFVPKYSTALGAWDCASDEDSLAALSCQSGDIPVYEALAGLWVCGADLDTDTQLTETQVDAFVANNNYSTGSHTTDTDSQLTETQVDAFVANNNYSTGSHTTNTDVLGGLSCAGGDVARYNSSSSLWTCAADAVLTETQVEAYISNGALALSGDFTVDTSTLVVDSANNRVGIGTASPNAILHVQGSGIAETWIENQTVGGTPPKINFYKTGASGGNAATGQYAGMITFQFKNDNGTDKLLADIHAYIEDASDGSEDGSMNFRTISGGVYDSRIYISNAGNVGIGTTGPSKSLHVKASANGDGIYLEDDGDGTLVARIKADSAGGSLELFTNGSTPSQTVRLDSTSDSWLNGGNVGIGTTSPGEKLTVTGTVESTSGGFKFPDGTTQASAASGGPGAIIYTRCAWSVNSYSQIGTCTPPACPTGWADLGINGNVKTESTDYGYHNSAHPESAGYQERTCHSATTYLVAVTRCSWSTGSDSTIGSCTPPSCSSGWTDLGVTGNVKTAVMGYGYWNSNMTHSAGYQERTCHL